MHNFKEALIEEQQRLEEIIARAKMENAHMAEGYLRISKHKNRCCYYHCLTDRNGTYIPKKNIILSKQLAQKAYNKSIIDKAEEQLSCKCQYKNDQKVENKNVHFPRSIPQLVFP